MGVGPRAPRLLLDVIRTRRCLHLKSILPGSTGSRKQSRRVRLVAAQNRVWPARYVTVRISPTSCAIGAVDGITPDESTEIRSA